MRLTRRRVVAVGVVAALLLIMAGLALWSPALPWAANDYDFALPGSSGLPYRIHYSGRDYATSGICARADWCNGEARTCEAPTDVQRELQADGQWPLREVGRVHTLPLGPSYPMLAASIPAGMTTMVLYVPYQGCLQDYALEGGP